MHFTQSHGLSETAVFEHNCLKDVSQKYQDLPLINHSEQFFYNYYACSLLRETIERLHIHKNTFVTCKDD